MSTPTGVGVNDKLARAAEHFKALDVEVRAWAAEHRDCVAGEVQKGGLVHLYRPSHIPAVPRRWPLVIGDCLHNVRAALDHLAWQLVIASGRRPTTDTAFPLNPTRKAAVVPKLSKPIRRQVKAVAPNTERDWLGILANLDNVDKHRTVLVVAAHNTGARQGSSAGTVKLLRARLAAGRPVARVDYPWPHPHVEPDVRFPVGVAFAERGVPNVDVGYALRTIIDLVNREILPRFQPFVPDLWPLPEGQWLRPPNALPI
jgi:hypothetical protein